MSGKPGILVVALETAAEQAAVAYARAWDLPCAASASPEALASGRLLVEIDRQQIYLRLPDASPRSRLQIDFGSGKLGYRQARANPQSELLLRALGARAGQGYHLVDATAGLGSDSALLVAAGYRVTALEQHPVLATMLEQARHKMLAEPGFDQMKVHCVDARSWLRSQPDEAVDFVYLDPMFPERGKSAQVKMPMQILQRLHSDLPEASDEGLLDAALNKARYRVVVKRPLRAAPLEGQLPTHQLAGKAVRFDIYALRSVV